MLECACGTGLLTRHIAPACKHIVAKDFSENRQFFTEAGYTDASFKMIEGRMPCAVAVLSK